MTKILTSTQCSSLLNEWKHNLELTCLEKVQLAEELRALDRQINRLSSRHIRISVFGRVGVGKSSLLNALIGKTIFTTDLAHGCTRKSTGYIWQKAIKNLQTIELIDTPGIDEISAPARDLLATKVALNSDLIILTLDSDITNVEIKALQLLLQSGKPVLLVLNRCDQWNNKEIQELLQSIKNNLPMTAKQLIIIAASAAPRKITFNSSGEIRREECKPDINSLQTTLLHILEEQGNILLMLNALRQAEAFFHSLKSNRLKRRRIEAQGLIGKFATIKASGVVLNPFLAFDLATGVALDTALVIQLSNLYGLKLKGGSARKLLKKLSFHNSLLGGVQLSIQFTLGVIQNLLFLSSPLTGGISLAPAAPVAIAQAAVAVQTTKITGRLAAAELLNNSHLPGTNPQSILNKLYKTNPIVRKCLLDWNITVYNQRQQMQSVLP